jgi:hypothetical protein
VVLALLLETLDRYQGAEVQSRFGVQRVEIVDPVLEPGPLHAKLSNPNRMCKTIQDSIFSGSLSYLTGGLLLATRKPKYMWLGAFVLIVGTMQWVDAGLWYSIQHNIPTRPLALAVVAVLVGEILAAYGGYVYYSGKRMPLYEIVMIPFILSIVYSWFKYATDTIVTKDGYLMWGNYEISSLAKIVFLLLILTPFIFYPDDFIKYALFGAMVPIFIYTFNQKEFGSRWCQSFFVFDILVLGKLLRA